MDILVFATNNEHKLTEVREILGDRFDIRSLKDINCHEELPETHDTLEENSMQKAQYVKEHYGYDCFADDTGLEVDALNGRPGVYSARYACVNDDGTPADDAQQSHDSEANMRKLLLKLEGKPLAERKAQFKTVVSLIRKGEVHQFTGIVKGVIATEKHGNEGFGYDPVFYPCKDDITPDSRTFAEMSAEEKNSMSHRGRAVEKLVAYLRKED